MTKSRKITLSFLTLLLLFVETIAAEIIFNLDQPWDLVLKTGEKIPVNQIVFDKDTSDKTIVIFQRVDGSKGFADIQNIVITDKFKGILSQVSEEISKKEGIHIDQLQPEPKPITESGCYTRKGYLFAVSEALYDKAFKMLLDGDSNAVAKLAASGVGVWITREGLPVYKEHVGGFLTSKTKFRVRGEVETFWTSIDAIKCN